MTALLFCSTDKTGCELHHDAITLAVLSHMNFACQRSDDLILGEVFQTMSKKEHTKVWTSLLKTVAPIVDEGRFLSQEEQEEGEEQVCQRVNAIMVLPQLGSRRRSRSSKKASERYARTAYR